MYAVISDRGRQHRVAQGDRICLDLLEVGGQPVAKGETVRFDQILLVSGDDGVKVGSPTVEGAEVVARVEGKVRGDKQVIYKYKRRKGYHLKKGHRQGYTKVRIESIKA